MTQHHPLTRHCDLQTILAYTRTNWWRPLHPSVCRMLRNGYSPSNWHLLALEMPSVPENEDQTRVAYWQSDAKQARDLRTVTSLGKYLRRHFPGASDHTIRDEVALAAPATFEIWTGADKMVKAAQEGPRSCMQWDDDDLDLEYHPYQVYSEGFGWGVAVRLQGTTIMGRAVVHMKRKIYVRSYGVSEHEGRSQDDNALEAWLNEQGYSYRSYWPEGVKFRKIDYRSHYLMPYLDGDGGEYRRVTDAGDCLKRDDDGEFVCDNTDGSVDYDQRVTCDRCDSAVDEGDLTWVDAEEQSVCDHCLCHHFTYVRGTRESQNSRVTSYYVRDSQAVEVDGENYDEDYLPSCIITLYDGDLCHEDNAVWVEAEDEYYPVSEVSGGKRARTLVVQLHDSEYALRENACWCEHNEEWYLQDDCTEFEDETWCCTDDEEDYLLTLTEAELREKLDDEQRIAEIMASEDWDYAGIVQAPPAELPETVPAVPVEASTLVNADYSKLEERVIAQTLTSPATCTTACTTTHPLGADATVDAMRYAMVQLARAAEDQFGVVPVQPTARLRMDYPIRLVAPEDIVRITTS